MKLSRFGNKRRVAVMGYYGILYYVPVTTAEKMLREKQAVMEEDSLRLPTTLRMLPRTEREDNRSSTSSNKTTFVQRVNEGRHRLIQLKHIPTALKPLYNTAVEECITNA